MLDRTPRVLVLCTGNSCRSQMAAAYLRHYGGGRLEVSSAGTEPAAAIHPLTVKVMAEDGHDLGDRAPQDYRRFADGEPIDFLILVCDGADRACPSGWPGVGQRLSWPFDDPAALSGPEEQVLAGFRRVRDQIKDKTRTWLASMDREDPLPLRTRAT